MKTTVTENETGGDSSRDRHSLEAAVVRFAGDSGDGMQLTGNQFTLATAIAGNDLGTFPDFPAEIRAPLGTTFGVSSFQINFGARDIRTAGDDLDVLVCMNPAALKTNLDDLKDGGLLIADVTAFQDSNIKKAGYTANPLDDDKLNRVRLLALEISRMTLETAKARDDLNITKKEAQRSKNMWALGLVLWLFDRDTAATKSWLQQKFARLPEIAAINIACLEAGHAFGETAELPSWVPSYDVASAQLPAGEYRTITGTEAICWGVAAGIYQTGLSVVYCSYPITPASNMLHGLTSMGADFGIETFQAEDEIAAICAAIGASYAGKLGITGSSGPGIALKGEALGLAAACELPLVVVNAQRGGPSTGLPTKTEQSDLYQAVFGRNADAPLPVLATCSPGDCFDVMREAMKLAVDYMTPVIILSDGYLANASEPWLIPDIAALPRDPVRNDVVPADFAPYRRDSETLARPWVAPGTPGGAHRIGGIERADITGNVSYDPANHQLMTRLRAEKIARIADVLPEQTVEIGDTEGDVAVLAWGSTFGPVSRAVMNLTAEGLSVAHVHLRYIWPLPRNLGDLLSGFKKILVPEMNNGQLATLIRSQLLRNVESLPKVSGKPFKVSEIEQAVRVLSEEYKP